MLIWLPEYFHPFAANGILKILEEPPENTIFLLVTNEPERLLGTILSRTQTINIPKYSASEIAEILRSDPLADPDKIEQVVRISDGSLSHAYKLLEKVEADHHKFFVDWMRKCYNIKELDSLVRMAEDFHRMSKIEQRSFLEYGLTMMRESLIMKNADELSRLSGAEYDFLKKFSKFLDISKVEKITEQLNQAIFHLDRNGSPKMTFLDISLQMMEILKN
jgi:DNA polymerase-3 subunit delta'